MAVTSFERLLLSIGNNKGAILVSSGYRAAPPGNPQSAWLTGRFEAVYKPGMTPRISRTTVLSGLVLIGTAVMFAVPSAQQPAAQGGGRGAFGSNFTGPVAVLDSKEMRTSRIRFDAGARTNWHLHSTGQLLLVEEGRGRLYEMGAGKVVDVKAGEPVFTRPNVLHWHGAAPDSPAVQFSVYSGMLEWKEAVTDEEYAGRTLR
jgi:quercetin dioxygenase-like cupin family protein